MPILEILNSYTTLDIPFAHESIAVSSTAIGLTAATYGPSAGHACVAFITSESDSMRWRIDGTDPTDAVGMLLTAGSNLNLTNHKQISAFKAIRVTGDATLKVTYSRNPDNVPASI